MYLYIPSIEKESRLAPTEIVDPSPEREVAIPYLLSFTPSDAVSKVVCVDVLVHPLTGFSKMNA